MIIRVLQMGNIKCTFSTVLWQWWNWGPWMYVLYHLSNWPCDDQRLGPVWQAMLCIKHGWLQTCMQIYCSVETKTNLIIWTQMLNLISCRIKGGMASLIWKLITKGDSRCRTVCSGLKRDTTFHSRIYSCWYSISIWALAFWCWFKASMGACSCDLLD